MRFQSTFIVLSLIATILYADDKNETSIVISGGFRGRVEGCSSCPSSASGGLGRRATAFKEQFADRIPVGLDCGSILDLDPEGGMSTTRCTFFGLARMGLKVIGVTPRDMFYGVDFLKSLSDSAGIILVSGNIVDAASGEPLFQAWTIVQVGTKKLAVTSLSNYQSGRKYLTPIGWTISPQDSIINDLNESAPEDADYKILLTNMGEGKIREFIKNYQYFDLVVTSSRQFYSESAFLMGNVLVTHPSPDGRTLNWALFHNGTPPSFHSKLLSTEVVVKPLMNLWLEECLGREPLETK